MENQLLFENQSLFNKYENSFKLIETGQFKLAYDNFSAFLKTGLDHSFIFNLLKSLSFWLLRSDKKISLKMGNKRIEFLLQEWEKYENFIENNQIYHPKVFYLMKKSVFDEIINNFSLSLDMKEEINPLFFWETILYLFHSQEYKKAYEATEYLLSISEEMKDVAKPFLANIIYFYKDKNTSLMYLKKYFIYHSLTDLNLITIPELLDLIQKLKAKLMSHQEIGLWLPVFALLENIFPQKSIKVDNKIYQWIYNLKLKLINNQNLKSEIDPKLIYGYLILLEENYFSKSELENKAITRRKILSEIEKINKNIFLKAKKLYE